MTLIIINDNEKIPLPQLLRLALKKIYEPKKLTFTEERKLHRAVLTWVDYLANQKDIGGGTLGAVDEECQIGLEIIASLLHQDDEGELDQRKELFRRKGIDYKKFHRLPEAYKPEDFVKAQEHLKQHMKDNPGDYA